MRDLHLASGLMVAAVMASGAMAQGVHQSRNEHAAVGPVPSVQPLTNAFTDAHPQTRLLAKGDRIVRVYGRAFSTGATASASASAFIANHASMFGAEPADLIPVGPFPDGRHVQPIMFDAASGTYKFTGLYYTQTKAGIPVYGSRLTLLVRNEPGFPLVLAGAEMHDLDGFDATVQDKALLAPEVVTALASRFFARQPGITAPELVIWAGLDGADAEPRLAYALTGRSEDPFDVEMPEMLDLVLDAMSGELLHMEDGIVEVDIPGTVAGVSNVDEGAFFCSPLAAQGLPYARVTAGLNQTYAAADGGFVLGYGGSLPVTVNATLTGPYFFVNNIAGPNTTASITYSDGVANLNFNGIPSDEITAQVNAYLQANIVRDFALAHNPAYPVVSTQTDFPVYVNRTGGICPGNAWYDSGAFAINFCSAGGGYPNTAYWKIVHHEYGHHLVNVGGSGQGMYGEGMGDTIGVCISDTPELALGFFGDCNEPLRNADNTLQYPCSGEIHFCGQLIAGAVWDTRNELIVTEPDDYLDILSSLTVNSILLHNGNSIDPSITIDFLTLDDDNGDILDGTPHYSEIAAGFGAHNLDAPALALIGIEFPDGRPDLIGTGGTIVRVEAVGIAGTPVPGTGRLHYDAGNGPVVV
ncbi:MAG: hypothetical protein KDA25_03000, partial [Phycisphaerales bacterium]|nr:hypothetical protein [Phycisphaerales bacterium]